MADEKRPKIMSAYEERSSQAGISQRNPYIPIALGLAGVVGLYMAKQYKNKSKNMPISSYLINTRLAVCGTVVSLLVFSSIMYKKENVDK